MNNISMYQSDFSIAEQLKAKRIRLNMTQKELADAVGMPKYGERTIRRWENGESRPSQIELSHILNFPEKTTGKTGKMSKSVDNSCHF